MANPNLKIPSYDDWVKGGTYQTGQKLDPNDKNMKGYYDNYKKVVKDLIKKGNLSQAQATVQTHGHSWKKAIATSTATGTATGTATATATVPTKTAKAPTLTKTSTAPTFKKTTELNVPAEPTEKAKYEGPAHDPNKSIIPTDIELLPVSDDEFVENRIRDLLDKNNPLFREAAEARVRAMAGRGLGRNASMGQEEVMRALFSVAGPIAEADARMLERHRTLQNTAYYEDMNTRLKGVIQETLSHIAGGYQIQAANIADITNRWKTKVAAELQRYGIDVDAELKKYGIDIQKYGIDVDAELKEYGIDMQKYGIDVGFDKAKYVADLQFQLGKMGIDVQLQGIKIDAATILSTISDNAEASAFIWDMIFGDNLPPSEWIDKWKDMWDNSQDDDDDDDGEDTEEQTSEKEYIDSNINRTNWSEMRDRASAAGILDWFQGAHPYSNYEGNT